MFGFLIFLAIMAVLSPLIRLAFRAGQEKEISPRELRISVIGSVVGIIVVSLSCCVPGIYTDYLFFENLTFASVFTTQLFFRWGLFFGAGFVAFIIFKLGSLLILKTVAPFIDENDRGHHQGIFGLVPTVVSAVLAVIFAIVAMSQWQNILWYLNQVPAGTMDPIFQKDISFYLYSLPVYQFFSNILLLIFGILIFAALITFWAYDDALKSGYRSRYDDYDWRNPEREARKEKAQKAETIRAKFWGQAMPIVSFLGIGLFGALIWKTCLAPYGLLTAHHGAVFGAGYVDINVRLIAYKVFIAVLALAILVLIVNCIWRKWKPAVFSLSGVVAIWMIATLIIPACWQAWSVEPSGATKEIPYLEHNIQFTRQAYGLAGIEKQEFEIMPLTEEALVKNQLTLDNIRIWDWRALQASYTQYQRLGAPFYEFPDIDIDRYVVNGHYRQVMLSARELEQKDIPPQAQTWANLNLVYTHGYGFVLNTVNEFLAGGAPKFLVKDIPPKSQVPEIEVSRPEIYFGDLTRDPVFVKTGQKEFDYPGGETCIYQEAGGVALGSGLRKFMFGWRFNELNILISEHLEADTQVLYYRNIQERLEKIAPFLRYDKDDYLIAEKGRLYYIVDAYTVSSEYPYSEPYNGINYIRNSVKAVIDAYTGKVDFYIFDGTDPIIKTIQKTFPALFKSKSEMPDYLLKHIRYPEDLLSLQARVYSIYHMTDAQAFYEKQEAWEIAKENYGHGGAAQEVLPYFVIIKLAGENKEEFLQMIPLTPKGRDNLVAWMADRCDGQHYAKALVYEFTKQSLVLGTLQFESLVDQNPEMSAQFTLWGQSGSEVIRGNTLVIPVEQSLIYVEPVYLKSTQKSQMPTLTKVIVATQKETGAEIVGLDKSSQAVRVEWGDTFEEALRKVMGTKSVITPPTPVVSVPQESTPAELTPAGSEQTVDSLVKQANYYFAEYQRLTGEGKLIEAAQALEKLKGILGALAELTK